MDHFKQQKNNENNKIKEKRTNLNDLNTPKNAVLKSHIRPHSSEIDIDLNNFGRQFDCWKKGLNDEAGESPLKSLINEVDVKIRKTNQKIDTADEFLKMFVNAERDFDSSLNELFKIIETPTDDFDSINVLLDSFIESSADLQEVLETAKDLIEKPTM